MNGTRANDFIKYVGLDGIATSEVIGFNGGVWF